MERIAEDEAIRSLLVFDQDAMEVDYRKKRATSCKQLPGPMTPAQEQEEECRRVEWTRVF
jgi:hypothetical protein